MAWYRSLYAPHTGGAYDSHHRTAGIAGRTWRRSGGMAGRGACVKSSGIGGNKKSQSDNYREQSHRCYPNDQKRQCGRVVVEPMFVHTHEDHSPCKNERVLNAGSKGKQTLNLVLQPRHTWALSNSLHFAVTLWSKSTWIWSKVCLEWRLSWPMYFKNCCCIPA